MVAQPKKKKLTRTIAYYQLVTDPKHTAFDELDWNDVLRKMGTKTHRHRILEKDITGRVVTMSIKEHWHDALQPPWLSRPAMSWHDETAFVLVLTTDRDHVPNQRKSDGTLKAMGHDPDGVPATASIVMFVPFGNMIAVLHEDNTAVRANYIGTWVHRVLQAADMLPQHNLHIATVPVIDADVEAKLRRSKKLSMARIGGRVRGSMPSAGRGLLGGGPRLEGSFDFDLKIRPVKDQSGETWEADAARVQEWFEQTFGTLVGTEELSKATFKPARTPDQADLPHQELNLIKHRLTHKRQIQIAGADGGVPSISALSAGEQLVEAMVLDMERLRDHR